jgi:hypothetical protein
MEEVVGSIPTRSTNLSNNLAGASVRRQCVCVMVCVITCLSGACGKGFHRRAFGFHADVAVPFQHLAADVSGERHDGGVRCTAFRKGRDRAVPQIVEPETWQPRFLGQCPPCSSPAIDVRSRVKAGDGVTNDLFPAEGKFGNERGKDVMCRFHWAKEFGPCPQSCQGGASNVCQWDCPLPGSRLAFADC